MATTWYNWLSHNTFTFSNGNLTATHTASAWFSAKANSLVKSGKAYFEIVATDVSAAANSWIGGVATIDLLPTQYSGQTATSWSFSCNAYKRNNNTNTSYGSSLTDGDVLMIAIDLTNSKIWFGKNGSWFDSSDPAAGTNAAYTNLSGWLLPVFSANNGDDATLRATAASFSYTPPTGFLPWQDVATEIVIGATAEIPSPTINTVDGGTYQLIGTVTESGMAGAYPVSLFDQISRRIIATTWSDDNGNFIFSYLANRTNGYFTIAFDIGDNPKVAAVSDGLTPTAMTWITPDFSAATVSGSVGSLSVTT